MSKLNKAIVAKFLYTTQDGAQVWEYEILSWPVKL